jgi:hypothetical protein
MTFGNAVQVIARLGLDFFHCQTPPHLIVLTVHLNHTTEERMVDYSLDMELETVWTDEMQEEYQKIDGLKASTWDASRLYRAEILRLLKYTEECWPCLEC